MNTQDKNLVKGVILFLIASLGSSFLPEGATKWQDIGAIVAIYVIAAAVYMAIREENVE